MSGLAALAAKLRAVAAAMPAELRVAAAEGGAHAVEETKKIMGTYPSGDGPFWEWPELKDSTQQSRVRAGYTPNNPLVASGTLKSTVSHKALENGIGFKTGSSDPNIVFSEHGTSNEEPRPVLGRGVYESREYIIERTISAVRRAFERA